MELMQASRQWASRPQDERFTSLIELDNFVRSVRENSKAKVLSSRAIQMQPIEGDSRGLVCVGPNGGPVALTHWSFGQLAGLAGAPAGYLRTIASPLAADCLNYGLHVQRDVQDVGILLYKNGGSPEVRAATGPGYGRVWNESITGALVSRFGDGISGDWRVPGEFGHAITVTKDNTTLYASDRDMFVFLADEQNRIEVPGRRHGAPGEMARGFFVWNSETGSRTLGVATFLFDYVCANRIVWGAEQYKHVTIRHTAGAPDRFLEEVGPALESMSQSSAHDVVALITDAKRKRIDNVDEFLAKRFTRSQAKAIQAAHLSDEDRPIETLWDATTGVTAYARGIQWQDERVDLERQAGRILDMAA